MSFLSMALTVQDKPLEEVIQSFPIPDPVPCPTLTGDSDLDPVLSMRLSEFSRSGSWLRIHSRVLEEDLIMAANDASDIPEGIPVYTADELKLLFGSSPEGLREVHRIKKHFNGSIYDRRKKSTGGILR